LQGQPGASVGQSVAQVRREMSQTDRFALVVDLEDDGRDAADLVNLLGPLEAVAAD